VAKKRPDINDTLREEGEEAARARFDSAKPFRVVDGGDEPPPGVGEAPLIISSGSFIDGFTPPDYFIEDVLQRRFLYSCTALTGAGKTAILLRIAAHTALGLSIGEHRVEKGRVLYMAGENPDDIRMRWIAMADRMGFDVKTIDVHFIPGVFSISALMARIAKEAKALGGLDLVIVDTSAAYFEDEDENDNKQMGAHARMLRELCKLPGEPIVLVACHPTKNASNDNLLPRGGGAFLNEVDGNLTAKKRDIIVELHWQGKFRGPDFEPILFELITATCDTLKDSKGRPITTVMAAPLSEKGQEELKASARKDEDDVLSIFSKCPSASIKGIAEALGWQYKNGKPAKSRVQRAIEKLSKAKLVTLERDRWQLTDKGKAEAKRITGNAKTPQPEAE
jgi:hypothetical protein